AVEDRAAPGEGLAVLDQVGYRDHLHAVVLERDDVLLVVGHQPATLDGVHLRLARAVDVRVQQPDVGAVEREGRRDVGRHRRLADAALAGADGHDVIDAGQRLLLHVAWGGERDPDLGRADVLAQRGAHLSLEPFSQRTRGRGELQRERHAAGRDRDVSDQTEADDVAPRGWVLNLSQRVENALFGECHKCFRAYQRRREAHNGAVDLAHILGHVNDASRLERGERYSVARDVTTYRGVDPLTGLEVLIYDFPGEPTAQAGSVSSDHLLPILAAERSGGRGSLVAALPYGASLVAPGERVVDDDFVLQAISALRDAHTLGLIHGDLSTSRILYAGSSVHLEGYGVPWAGDDGPTGEEALHGDLQA